MEIFYGFLGAAFASFLNALAYRINTTEKIANIWTTPSHCEVCKKQLRWYDMIPVLSYLLTSGRCSQCGTKVFWYYPLSELFLFITFTSFAYFGLSYIPYLVVMYLFFLSYFDVSSHTIPKDVTDTFLVISLVYLLYRMLTDYSPLHLISLVIAAAIFIGGFIANRKKEVVGMGDIIILSSIFLAGLQLGLLTFALTIFLAGIFASGMVLKNRENIKKYIPLVPFITFAYALASVLATLPFFIDILSPLW